MTAVLERLLIAFVVVEWAAFIAVMVALGRLP